MAKKILKRGKSKADTVEKGPVKYILRLFVTGILTNSLLAIKNVNIICEKYLRGRYELEVIDIYQQPALAVKEGIIAVPMLIKVSPLPEERMIGDLSNIKTVLKALQIK